MPTGHHSAVYQQSLVNVSGSRHRKCVLSLNRLALESFRDGRWEEAKQILQRYVHGSIYCGSD